MACSRVNLTFTSIFNIYLVKDLSERNVFRKKVWVIMKRILFSLIHFLKSWKVFEVA